MPLASVVVYGSIWCQTLIDGSTKEVITFGAAGFVVSMITPCESAAEYAREPESLNVMSCDSVPRPGRVGSVSSPTLLAAPTGVEMSWISIAGWNDVIRSEFEL